MTKNTFQMGASLGSLALLLLAGYMLYLGFSNFGIGVYMIGFLTLFIILT